MACSLNPLRLGSGVGFSYERLPAGLLVFLFEMGRLQYERRTPRLCHQSYP